MAYRIHEGRLSTWSLEIHVTDHCNLACAGCCTLSPHLATRFCDPEQVAGDLARVAPVLRPQVVKLTGGEPLLHPDIVRIAEITRASGVGERVSMTTNGHLFGRAPDALLEALDRVTVSWYASAPLSEAALDTIRRRCEDHSVRLNLKHYEQFQTLDCQTRAPSDARTAAIFDACWLKGRCHLLHRGRFYLCTRPPHLDDVLGRGGALVERDGLALDDVERPGRLKAYLEREEALDACGSCLGGGGPWRSHRQLTRAQRAAGRALT